MQRRPFLAFVCFHSEAVSAEGGAGFRERQFPPQLKQWVVGSPLQGDPTTHNSTPREQSFSDAWRLRVSTEAEEVERLRRVAYGPESSAQERAEAEAALRALDQPETAMSEAAEAEMIKPEATTPEAIEREAIEPEATTPGEVTRSSDETREQRALGMRPVWLIPIVVASLVVGALGALGATDQLAGGSSAAETSASPMLQGPGGLYSPQYPVGDLEAADGWFTGDPKPLDTFPDPDLLEANSIDPDEVRLLKVTSADEGSVTVWAGANRLGHLCLLVTNGPERVSVSTCATRADFSRGGGLGFRIDGFLVSWDGREVAVDRIAG